MNMGAYELLQPYNTREYFSPLFETYKYNAYILIDAHNIVWLKV